MESWSSDGHVFNLRCSHGTRGSAAQRGAAPAWRPPGPAAAFMVKIKDVFKRSDCILIIRFKQLTFRQLSISSNRRDHDGIGLMFLKAAMMGLITFTKSFYVDCTFRLYTYEYVVCRTPVDTLRTDMKTFNIYLHNTYLYCSIECLFRAP